MNQILKFKLDGVECMGYKDQYITNAAAENGFYIPTLCNIPGVKPRGACRICNVRVNGKLMTACTTPLANGMVIECQTEELKDLRKAIIELMLTEGNHFCPSCEKSGNCELQALAYRFNITVPRFKYQFPERDIEASHPKLIKDHNRCILCKRCIRVIKDEQGRNIFAFGKRGNRITINIDTELANDISDENARMAYEICPVGAILLRENAFREPIGKRKFDHVPIGIEMERFHK